MTNTRTQISIAVLGDCMEGLRETPDKFYDLAVIDPRLWNRR